MTLTERLRSGKGADVCPACNGSGVRTGTSWDDSPNCFRCGGTGLAAKEGK